MNNGKPAVSGSRIQNYDNLGYILGPSSNIFTVVCAIDEIGEKLHSTCLGYFTKYCCDDDFIEGQGGR